MGSTRTAAYLNRDALIAGWAASDESHPSRGSLRWSARTVQTGRRRRWPLVDRFEDGPVRAPVHRVLDEDDPLFDGDVLPFRAEPSTRGHTSRDVRSCATYCRVPGALFGISVAWDRSADGDTAAARLAHPNCLRASVLRRLR